MAFYNGWDREEMRRIGSNLNQAGETNQQFAQRPIPSFTPVNPLPAPVQFISPQRTLHERDIYEIVEDPNEQVEVPLPVPKKRIRAQNKPRAVSVDPLWEHLDEGDLAGQNNGRDFETTFPKRRKATSTKRTNSSRATPNTLSQFLSKDDGEGQNGSMDTNEQTGSQLTTPPDSGKPKKKRAVSAKAQTKKPKMGPFKAPTITKPTVSRPKDVIEEPSEMKPSRYLGFVTTQESVKLAKTTLDKLAAFRYTPSSTAQQEEHIPEVQHNVLLYEKTGSNIPPETGEEFFGNEAEGHLSDHELFHEQHFDDSAGYENYLNTDDHGGPLNPSKQDHISGNHAFFDEATWNVQIGSQPRYSGQLVGEETPSAVPEPIVNTHVQDSDALLKAQDQTLDTSRSSQPVQSSGLDSTDPTCDNAAQKDPRPSLSQFEPDSSEKRIPLDTFDICQTTHEVRKDVSNSPRGVDLPMDQASMHQISPDMDGELLHISSVSQSPSHQDPSSQVLPALIPGPQIRQKDASKDIQVERSDMDDVDVARVDASKDFDLDDFDEGLNESDLMALMSQPVVPATQSPLASRAISGDSGPESRLTQVQPADNKGPHSMVSIVAPDDPSKGEVMSVGFASPIMIDSDFDDEFPLDDDIEEKMMNLAGSGAVLERFQPPASLQHPSEGSISGEVYDKELLFSPPKPIRPHRSPNRKTNLNSANQSPSVVPEPLLDDEEDWSFIRSNDESVAEIQRAGSQHPKMQAVSPQEVQNIMEVSPARSRMITAVSPASRQHSTSQMTMASTKIVLDDSHEYEPMKPFARPDFPSPTQDRSPIVGLSPQSFLRVCFRVAEMLKEGARRNSLKEDAVIELFARVTHSFREPSTSKQHFEFADLWHDRQPYPTGILGNYKSPELLKTESSVFIGAREPIMARCFGRLKRDSQNTIGWSFDIISIRTTDWEEIRWTKRIVGAGLVKSEVH